MNRAPVTITVNDVIFLNADHFTTTKQVLSRNPTADAIIFVIHTNSINLNLDHIPVSERYPRYEMQVTVNLAELRPKYKDIDSYTSGVLLRLFDEYKTSLVLH